MKEMTDIDEIIETLYKVIQSDETKLKTFREEISSLSKTDDFEYGKKIYQKYFGFGKENFIEKNIKQIAIFVMIRTCKTKGDANFVHHAERQEHIKNITNINPD